MRRKTSTLLIVGLLSQLIPNAVQAESTGIYERFELAVENGRDYSDPFRDVRLDISWTGPNGREVEFWGFFDGGSTWRARFMPDQLGTWRFRATFSDGSRGREGAFECVPSDAPGMLAVNEANPIWFGYSSGRPGLIRSFHVGDRFFAENWPAEKRTAFLDWAQGQGYNMLSVASHYLNREVTGRGQGWITPDLWDGRKRHPRPAEYGKMEAILDDLAGRRMMVFPFAGFFGQSSDFPTDRADQELYVRYTLARIGPYWNILLNVAGPEPIGRNQKFQNAMSMDEITRLGRLIARLDPFGHPLTIHNPGGDDPHRISDWSTFVTLQGWKDRNWPQIYAGMLENHTGTKPVYAQEVFWPGNKYGHKEFTEDEIRKKAYVLLMAATTINFGDMAGDSSSGFSGSLELEDRVQRRHDIVHNVSDFFEEVPYYRMRPHPEAVDRGFCLAEPGKEYLIYLVDGGSVNVRMTGPPATIQWVNARDTSDRRAGGVTTDGRNLAAPSDGDDWLLWLRSGNGASDTSDSPSKGDDTP